MRDPQQPPPPATTELYDRAAARLLAAIRAACEPGAEFSAQVEAALSAVLSVFSADPAGARLLTAEASPEPRMRACYIHWSRTYADLLRDAAVRSPRPPSRPSCLEPFLISGIRTLIRRRLDDSKDTGLDEFLPTLIDFILTYYPERDPGAAGSTSDAGQGRR